MEQKVNSIEGTPLAQQIRDEMASGKLDPEIDSDDEATEEASES